ncbi:MAG TPA: TIM-barrel domain-containing protein [Cyclobacteriaceae bacterium]|nr:TIM-barrel domain-containing protein [Cyclobacteriaceae bacterium]
MMRQSVIAKIILCLTLFSCARPAYEKLSDGVLVRLKGEGTRQVKLQVVADNIIRVVASPSDTFSRDKSLAVLNDLKIASNWKAEKSGDNVTLSTKSLRAIISLITGEVSFTDSTGKVLLSEKRGGGKYFEAAKVEDYACNRIRQVFESSNDEAFYGLGGHQNGQMNYKGQDVELAQHNIVDVIPFLYSSKNYGILWDNYSISKFGDPRDYQPLNSIDLFTKDGKPGGLTATYFVKDKVVKSVVEDKIDYEFLETPQVEDFPKDVSRFGHVEWEGFVSSSKEGEHKFVVYSAGYVKVWLDEKLILDKWRQNWNPWTNKFTLNIKPGERHKIKIEWTPDDGRYMAMKHLDPVTSEEQNQLSLFSEVGCQIDYYFIQGSNADEVIKGYRTLTGKAPIVPKWAMGFWQSRERYRSQKEIIEVGNEYRKQHIPIDNIVLDWQYWEDPKWGSHEFDATRFPDPKGMINELHNDLHMNLMISVWPKFNKGTANYDEMNKNGFLFTRNIERRRKDWVGVGYENTFYNPFKEGAGKLFWKQINSTLNKDVGVDAWWLDATEPDIHSNLSIEERKLNMSPTGMGPGAKYFNAYSLLNSKNVYEGQRESSPEKRVFILTRSAFAGQQRYGSATWSGDIVSRWSDFKDQIATGINFSLSGIPYWTMDIGGFAVEHRYEHATGETLDEWRELNNRWFQFGAFCPLFRSHGQYPFREIYNISPKGHEVYNSMVYYDKMRYRLMPYIYSLAGASYFNDYTILRGLVMDFNDDAKVRNTADQYMFGPSLMVNPVYEYKARSRSVYLPSTCGWYDFYTGKHYEGGQTIQADAPLNRIPLYVKEGSIIPAGPEIEYTSEKIADPITLYVFTGKDAHFELYEDESINYNYEHKKYATITFDYEEASGRLTIRDRKGSFKNILEERNFQIVTLKGEMKDHLVGVSLTAHPDRMVHYSGKEISINLNKK